MRKQYFSQTLFLLGLFTTLFFATPQALLAQTSTPTPTPDSGQVKQTERWACLTVAPCAQDSSKCSGKGVKVHRTKLTTGDNKLLPNADTYVVECVSTPQGPICTTGSKATDAVIFQSSTNLDTLASLMKYTFQFFTQADGTTSVVNPVKSDANGDIGPYEWQSVSKFTTRKFMAMNYVSPPVSTGQQNSQQQGTFDLEVSDSNCLSVRYDPYGIIFDSQTLEPIPNANVTLYEKVNGAYVIAGNSAETQGIDPTQKTEEDGLYNFVVPPGTYKVTAAAGGYNFPANISRVNQYYTKAYSNLYPPEVTPTPGVSDDGRDYDIIETSSIVRKDVPLDSVPLTANKRYPVTLMNYYYQLKNKYSTVLTVEGRVSHPFAKIKVYTVPTGATDPQQAQPIRLLTALQATKEGKFKFEVDQATFNQGEKFGKITIEKVDLSNGLSWTGSFMKMAKSLMDAVIPDVEAQQPASAEEIGFDPILNYVEGYAYNAKGDILSNATVGVYLKFSQKPSYTTKTDDTGYFRITSEYLPFLPYELRYTSATGVTNTVNTGSFIEQNEAIIKTKKIDLYTFRNSKGETVTPSPVNADSMNDTGDKKIEDKNGTGGKKLSNNAVMMIAIVLFLIVVGGLVMFYMMKNKKDQPRQI